MTTNCFLLPNQKYFDFVYCRLIIPKGVANAVWAVTLTTVTNICVAPLPAESF